jgi:hypothetical protein
VNCICVNKQWYISFAEEGEEGKNKRKEKTTFPSSWPQKKQQR